MTSSCVYHVYPEDDKSFRVVTGEHGSYVRWDVGSDLTIYLQSGCEFLLKKVVKALESLPMPIGSNVDEVV